MQWVTSVPGKLPGVALAAAIACILPFAAAQQRDPAAAGPGHTGHGHSNTYRQNGNAPVAPGFVSTFGPHSVVVPGRGVLPTGAPDYASSWGIAHQTGRERDREHRRSGRHGYAGVPIYDSWALMPWDYGYLDSNGYPGDESGAAAAEPAAQAGEYPPAQPEEHRPASHEEHRPAYPAVEREVAPPPPPPPAEPAPLPAAAAPPTTAPSTTALVGEPTLTLVFKDGHRQSVRNYALTGSSVIVLDNAASGRQQRIPLADLNVPATEQAAEAAGLDFSPPR